MKKFIKGKWVFGTIVVVMVFFLLIFLYCKGFRISYAPALENSWDAVSAFAAWFGVAMSSIAIMVAIGIPKEIADQQDKIALFEKRFLVFDEISKVIGLGQAIKTNPRVTLKYIYQTEIVNFGYNFVIDTADPESTIANSAVVHRTLSSIKQAVFLFPGIEKEEVNKLCEKFHGFFFDLLFEVLQNPNMMNEQFKSTSKSDFIAVSEEFKTKYYAHIVQYLHLTR